MRFIDADGRDPGDIFASPKLAALDFGNCYNDNSIKVNREYGTTIYYIKNSENKIVGYSYTVPTVGSSDGLFVINNNKDAKNTVDVADAHTHGAYDKKYKNNDFSEADKKSNDGYGNTGFLITPNGSIKEYDSKTKKTTDLTKESPEFSNIPSDQSDPTHVNNVDAKSPALPSSEPSQSTLKTIIKDIIKAIF